MIVRTPCPPLCTESKTPTLCFVELKLISYLLYVENANYRLYIAFLLFVCTKFKRRKILFFCYLCIYYNFKFYLLKFSSSFKHKINTEPSVREYDSRLTDFSYIAMTADDNFRQFHIATYYTSFMLRINVNRLISVRM